MINEMHKIAACIAWHTLNDRFIIPVVALIQISNVSPMFQWELSFLIEGLCTLNSCYMQILLTWSVLFKKCVPFFNRPQNSVY